MIYLFVDSNVNYDLLMKSCSCLGLGAIISPIIILAPQRAVPPCRENRWGQAVESTCKCVQLLHP